MARRRTFIGIQIGDNVRSASVHLQEKLAQTGASVKWVEPASMHLTLIFLGEIDDRELVDVCRIAAKVAKTERSFGVRVHGVGAFPNHRRPKTLWGGITEGAEKLQSLYAMLEDPLVESGAYRQEDRAYTPHLTLGRVDGEADGQKIAPEIPKYAEWDAGTFLVDELIVYSSEMRKGGPEYTVLGRAKLG